MGNKADRLFRLAGRGSDPKKAEQGAGLPLPPLFAAVLETLFDRGPRTVDELLPRVRSALDGKNARVTELYKKLEGDPWRLLLCDTLEQFEDRRIVQRDGTKWQIGTGFKPNTPMVVVPREGEKSELSITIFDPQERARRGRLSAYQHNIHALAQEMYKHSKGLWPVDHDAVATIMESIKAFGGYDPRFPILIDQHDRILDGRHRYIACQRLKIEPDSLLIPVDSDEEAIAIAIKAAFRRSIKKKDTERIALRLHAAGLEAKDFAEVLIGPKARRAYVAEALRADASRSDRDIGREVGCDHEVVGAVRAELEESGGIRHFNPDLGRGKTHRTPSTNGKPVRVSPELKRAKEYAEAHPEDNYVKVAAATGVSETTGRRATGVRVDKKKANRPARRPCPRCHGKGWIED